MILHPGQQIDRFVVERALGQGGMATVYRVRHTTLDAVYALKLLTVPSAAIRDRMLREGRFQATLRHSNIVSVIDVLDIHGVLGLLMEYIDGPSLDEWLATYRPSLREAMAVFGGVLSAVDMVHARGITHRDLKPSNVMLHLTDEGMYPRVTDFGIAKSDRLSEINTGSGATVGTPAYMAPEQFKNAAGVDQRADIFSLGALLYELVTGQRAFHADNLLALMNAVAKGEYTPVESLVGDLPDGVRAAIEGALRPDPDHRIPDCKRLAAVLTGQSAVHNIADAMQRRLFRSSPGSKAAIQLREDRRLLERGETLIPDVPDLDLTFGSPSSQRKAPPSQVTYDEPIGAYTEESQLPTLRPSAPILGGPGPFGMILLFMMALLMGMLGAVIVVWLSSGDLARSPIQAPQPVPSVPDREAGRVVPMSDLTGTQPSAAPQPVQPQPAQPVQAQPAPPPVVQPEPVVAQPEPVVPDPEPAAVAPPSRPEPVRPPPAPVTPDPVPATPVGTVRLNTTTPIRLISGGQSVPTSEPVPAGTYSIRADFGDGWQDAGSLTVGEGQTVAITCDAAFLVCRGS